MNLKELLLETVETLVFSAGLIFLIYNLVGTVEVVSGASMEPNFYTGERILVDRLFSRFIHKYNRGDVVVLTPSIAEDKHFIKRVVAVPGDIFKIYNCKVYISRDEKKFILSEEYLPNALCTSANKSFPEGRSFRVEADKYIVLGDNRVNSVDSRMFGFVDAGDILGRVVFRFWPLNRLGFIR